MIRKLYILLLVFVLAAPLHAAEPEAAKIVALLKKARQQDSKTVLPLFFARQFLGVPYVAHTLEVNDSERLVVNTRQMDCTTLVETVTALTLCAQRKDTAYAAFQHTLQAMRYRGGVIDGYPSRIHYFTDWIVENQKAGIAVQTVKVNYMSTHPQSYEALRKHPEYVAQIAKAERRITGQKFRYIPKKLVGRQALLRKAIKDGDIIAITCNKSGLDIAHLGFAVWKKDGLHLLNASQLHHKVVDEPMTLYRYLQKHPSHTGIRIIRITK